MKKLNILICGSQKFDDEDFVFNTLNTFYELFHGNIGTIITSKFSGACQFAENWAELMNETIDDNNKIKVKHFTFDNHLMQRNQSIYEQVDIPDVILQNDPFYIKGKELIMAEDIKVVMAFPNAEGVLGAATYNIQRFAALSGAKVFNCADLLEKRNNYRKEHNIETEAEAVEEQPAFNNMHPSKVKKIK